MTLTDEIFSQKLEFFWVEVKRDVRKFWPQFSNGFDLSLSFHINLLFSHLEIIAYLLDFYWSNELMTDFYITASQHFLI